MRAQAEVTTRLTAVGHPNMQHVVAGRVPLPEANPSPTDEGRRRPSHHWRGCQLHSCAASAGGRSPSLSIIRRFAACRCRDHAIRTFAHRDSVPVGRPSTPNRARSKRPRLCRSITSSFGMRHYRTPVRPGPSEMFARSYGKVAVPIRVANNSLLSPSCAACRARGRNALSQNERCRSDAKTLLFDDRAGRDHGDNGF